MSIQSSSSSSSSSSPMVPARASSTALAIPGLLQHIAQYVSSEDGAHLASTCSRHHHGMSLNNFLFHHKTGLVTQSPDRSARQCWEAYRAIVRSGVPPFLVDPLGGVFRAGREFSRLPRLVIFTNEDYPSLALADLPAPVCRGVFRRLPEPGVGIAPIDLDGPTTRADIEDALAIRRNRADTAAHYRPFIAMGVESHAPRHFSVLYAMDNMSTPEEREKALTTARATPPEREVEIFTRHHSIPDLWVTIVKYHNIVMANKRPILLPARGKPLIQAMGDKFTRLLQGGNVGYNTPDDESRFATESEARTIPSGEDGKEQSIVALI